MEGCFLFNTDVPRMIFEIYQFMFFGLLQLDFICVGQKVIVDCKRFEVLTVKNIKIILMKSNSMLFGRLVAVFWRNWLPPTEE